MSAPLATPVALIVFRRPEETARVIEAIAEASPTRLFVIADGPHADSPDEARACEAVRTQLERVRWRCEMSMNIANSNMGLKRRVESGLDWVFSQVGEAIILEDDCVPHPSFFPFCQQLLERYRDDDRVMCISGSNLIGQAAEAEESYYFSRYPLIWGWATWRRAWMRHDPYMRAWQREAAREWLARRLPDPAPRRYWSYHFQQTFDRRHTWDYAWTHACWVNNGLSVHPRENLVSNIGFGRAATHTFDSNSRFANIPAKPMSFPLRHPTEVAPDQERDLLLETAAYSGEELLKPMFRAIRAQVSSTRR